MATGPDQQKDLKEVMYRWTMGLQGIWGQMANLTAVGLICLLFYQYQQAFLMQAREDRAVVREELSKMHDESQKQWLAIKDNQIVLERLLVVVTSSVREHEPKKQD